MGTGGPQKSPSRVVQKRVQKGTATAKKQEKTNHQEKGWAFEDETHVSYKLL